MKIDDEINIFDIFLKFNIVVKFYMINERFINIKIS